MQATSTEHYYAEDAIGPCVRPEQFGQLQVCDLFFSFLQVVGILGPR